MLKLFRYLVLVCLLVSTPIFAANSFVAGKDYRILPSHITEQAKQLSPTPNNKVEVTEFFNYGCPACFHLEPQFEQWLAKKPANVMFNRIPVTFQPGWDVYAKAYYVADALGILSQITPAIFKAIHVDRQRLNNESALAAFFARYGIKQDEFNAIFNHSPSLDLALAKGDKLMRLYGIQLVPTIIVNHHYVVSMEQAKDPEKLFQLIDFLVKKETRTKNT